VRSDSEELSIAFYVGCCKVYMLYRQGRLTTRVLSRRASVYGRAINNRRESGQLELGYFLAYRF